MIIAILITIGVMLGAFFMFLISAQWVDHNSEDQPVRVVEYYYAGEGGE